MQGLELAHKVLGLQFIFSSCNSFLEDGLEKEKHNSRIKNQPDATCYFIVLLIGSTCFGYYYVHHQKLAIMMLITTLVVSFLVCCRLEVRCG